MSRRKGKATRPEESHACVVDRQPLVRLRLNGDTQPREKLDPLTVASYASDLKAGAKLPPVDVFWDGHQHWLADGFHRLDAHREAGQDLITCKVHAGTVEDARWFVDHDAWPCPKCGMEDWDAASETCRVCTKIDAANKQAADSGEKPGPLQGVTRKLADVIAAARATLTPQQLAVVAELLRDMIAELEE